MKLAKKILIAGIVMSALTGCSIFDKDEVNNNDEPIVENENNDKEEKVELLGEAEGFGGVIKVKVTLDGDVIESVEILEHKESEDNIEAVSEALESVPAAVVENNGTEDVDIISGATKTSEGILKAVENALESLDEKPES